MSYTREMLERWFPKDTRMQKAMELQRDSVAASESGLQTTAQSTERIEQASVLVLASNNAFSNERVLALDPSIAGTDDGNTLTLKTSAVVPRITGGFTVSIAAVGNSQFLVPLTGILATTGNPETLSKKTLATPKISGLGDFADDTAAAAGGVPVTGLYRTGSVVKVRVT